MHDLCALDGNKIVALKEKLIVMIRPYEFENPFIVVDILAAFNLLLIDLALTLHALFLPASTRR